jgi:hypothetical protein
VLPCWPEAQRAWPCWPPRPAPRPTPRGECFDGVFVNGGSYVLERPVLSLTGNGRCDFVGYGADCTLVTVNSVVANTGASGYGTYVIGDATEYLLGTRFDVGSYATIFTGGTATYGDSDTATVAALNSSLGLTGAELAAYQMRV